jgi:sec-independent protein translocase protein TatC
MMQRNVLILCIKALLVFGIAFVGCFFFAKHIFNVLIWPYVSVIGAEGYKWSWSISSFS